MSNQYDQFHKEFADIKVKFTLYENDLKLINDEMSDVITAKNKIIDGIDPDNKND